MEMLRELSRFGMVSVLTSVIQRKKRLFDRSLLLACFLVDLLELRCNKGKWLSHFNLTAVLALGLLFWLAKFSKLVFKLVSLLTEQKRLEMKV